MAFCRELGSMNSFISKFSGVQEISKGSDLLALTSAMIVHMVPPVLPRSFARFSKKSNKRKQWCSFTRLVKLERNYHAAHILFSIAQLTSHESIGAHIKWKSKGLSRNSEKFEYLGMPNWAKSRACRVFENNLFTNHGHHPGVTHHPGVSQEGSAANWTY